MTDRVALYRRLPVTAADAWWLELAAASPDGRVLELGAGTGRLTGALAATGAAVTAVERDPAMVAELSARLGATVTVVAGDVTDPATTADLGSHGLVLATTSLLNELPDGASRQAALHAAATACHPAGEVAIHLLSPWWLTRAQGSVTGQLTPADPEVPPVQVTLELGRFDVWPGRRQARMRYRFDDGQVHVDDLDAAVVSPGELSLALAAAGLEVVERWGNHRDGPGPAIDDPAWHLRCRPIG